jgi:uncharacterized membrane protein YfcA
MSPVDYVLLALSGVVVGAISALFGVGGGTVMVPLLVLVFAVGQHVAQGTSLLVIIPTAIAGVMSHHKKGYVDYAYAALLGAGGIVGANLGSRLALGSSASVLQVIFAAVLVFVGTRLVVQGVRKRNETRGSQPVAGG